MSNMPRHTFRKMRYTFGDFLDIDSEYVAMHWFAILSEVEPVYYDCCINSHNGTQNAMGQAEMPTGMDSDAQGELIRRALYTAYHVIIPYLFATTPATPEKSTPGRGY